MKNLIQTSRDLLAYPEKKYSQDYVRAAKDLHRTLAEIQYAIEPTCWGKKVDFFGAEVKHVLSELVCAKESGDIAMVIDALNKLSTAMDNYNSVVCESPKMNMLSALRELKEASLVCPLESQSNTLDSQTIPRQE